MCRIQIHIDRVVLDGVAPTDPDAFRDALAAELAGLARRHRGPYPRGDAASLHGAPLSVHALVGGEVAQSIWGSIVAGPARLATTSAPSRRRPAADACGSGPGR